MKFALVVVLVMFVAQVAHSQGHVRDSVVGITTIDLSYALHAPAGDLADRFGNSSMAGLGVHRKTDANWTFGGECWFMFGNRIAEEGDVLSSFRSPFGDVIGTAGLPSEIQLFQRGFSSSFQVGKIFSFLGPNPNSGIWIKLGTGYLQHRVLIDDPLEEFPLVSSDENKVGYDQLTGGIFFHQFVGYRHFSNDKRFNFYAGIDLNQGLGKSLRSWDYVERRRKTESRYDGLYGIKIAFSLALFKQVPQEFYYY